MVLIHIKQAQKKGIVVMLAARLHCHILALEESLLTLEECNSLQPEEESNCLQQEERKNPTSQEQEGRRIQVHGTRRHLHVSPPALPFSEY